MVLQRVTLALAVVFASLPSLPTPPTAAHDGDTLDLRLLAQPITSPDESALTEVLVKFRDASQPDEVHTLAVPEGLTQQRFLADLLARADVEWAEPNDLIRLEAANTALVPSDALYPQHQKWYYDAIDAEAAWGLPTRANPIVVAVLDSGVMCDHPDLVGQMWRNPREIPANGLDDDGNGRIDDVFGWDFVGGETGSRGMSDEAGDNDPCIKPDDPSIGNGLDDDGDGAIDPGVDHGTLVAGIIAASGNNATGVAGLCWSCRIMAVRVGNAEGWVRAGDVAAGIGYAAQNGARVINLSFGSARLSQAVKAAIEAARNRFGTVIVAAAGNGNVSPISCPACHPSTIAVGASDRGEIHGRAPFTNWGSNTAGGAPHDIDVVAPGVQLASTTICSVHRAAVVPTQCPQAGAAKYGINRSGTSFSTPLVAGLAALLLAHEPGLTPDQVRARLKAAATDLPDDRNDSPNAGPGWDGAGLINAYRTLDPSESPAPPAAEPRKPVIRAPLDGAVSTDLAPLLAWESAPGATQVHLQVVPYNNDGPGVNLIRNAADSYQIAAPKLGAGNYVLLPGMTYTWRVRTSASATPLGEKDLAWSEWTAGTFRTAIATGATISPLNANRSGLTWRNSASHVFYYEVQLSRDSAFGSDRFLYSELVHGGLTTPLNTYHIPARYPLESGVTYYWRVRPRIQGDGQPAPWSDVWDFRSP